MPIVTVMSPRSLGVSTAILRVLEPTGLCVPCLAGRAGVPDVVAAAELAALNEALAQRGCPALGPRIAHCLRCERRAVVYRLV